MPLRVFFALWPAPELQRDLHALATRQQTACGGRVLRADTLHLTLAFIAALPEQQLDQLYALAAKLVTPTFNYAIDQLGYWHHSGIVWATGSQPSIALLTLANALRTALAAGGIAFDASQPFAPHISLLREAQHRPKSQPDAALSWPVSEFALVLSEAQNNVMRYRVLRRWALA